MTKIVKIMLTHASLDLLALSVKKKIFLSVLNFGHDHRIIEKNIQKKFILLSEIYDTHSIHLKIIHNFQVSYCCINFFL